MRQFFAYNGDQSFFFKEKCKVESGTEVPIATYTKYVATYTKL